MANIVDLIRRRAQRCLICVYTACSGLFIPILRVITESCLSIKLNRTFTLSKWSKYLVSNHGCRKVKRYVKAYSCYLRMVLAALSRGDLSIKEVEIEIITGLPSVSIM